MEPFKAIVNIIYPSNTKMESKAKLNLLKRIESEAQTKWENNKAFQSNVNTNMPKYMATFPFPYVNGRPHLGHGLTLTKADFATRAMKLHGFNTLFPFGFHGTGMPIVACAKKLELELKNGDRQGKQGKILTDMEVPDSDLEKFTDPNYWLKYFPEKTIEDVTAIGASVDFRRSFVTTSLNPHFDKFVTWQFNKLKAKNLITYGKRYVIYSAKDGQPCADHDRSSGEGVNPVCYEIEFVEKNKTYVVSTRMEYEDGAQVKYYYNPALTYVLFEYNNMKFIVQSTAYQNIRYQLDDTVVIDENVDVKSYIPEVTSCKLIRSTGIYTGEKPANLKQNLTKGISSHFKYYEPETDVVSRSGDICVVSLTNQWFINYGNEILKEKVNHFINTKSKCQDKVIIKQLHTCSNWLDEWPCSRHYGLGTILPGTEYVIDSLSDSTIYMSYYTIAHLIRQIPSEQINDDLFNCVFLDGPVTENIKEFETTIQEMIMEFKYWYPVNLRVSGKDLVNNHLTMALYNHVAIWDSDIYCPEEYAINGYMLLNGKKMAKSEGNFMTLKEAVNKYGADATRLTFAEGEGMEDSDFSELSANANIMRLASEREWFIDAIEYVGKTADENKEYADLHPYDFWDNVFSTELDIALSAAKNNFLSHKFRKAVVEGFYSMLAAKDQYRSMKPDNMNRKILVKFIEYALVVIQPICPHWVENLWDICSKNNVKISQRWCDITNEIKHDNGIYYYRYYSVILNNIKNQINSALAKQQKKNKAKINKIIVTVINNYTDTEKELIEYVSKYDQSTKWNDYISPVIKKADKKYIGDYGKFMTYVKSQMELYGSNWTKWIENSIEFSLVSKWLPIIMENSGTVTADITCSLEDKAENHKFKHGPGYPIVAFE
jgi:leucyl-tRNA synthetase